MDMGPSSCSQALPPRPAEDYRDNQELGRRHLPKPPHTPGEKVRHWHPTPGTLSQRFMLALRPCTLLHFFFLPHSTAKGCCLPTMDGIKPDESIK